MAEAKVKLDKPRIRTNTRDELRQAIERLNAQQTQMSKTSRFTYETGSDYQNGILGHSDIIKMVPELIGQHPLLKFVVAQQFPFIFVDESQDTVAEVVDALKAVQKHASGGFCLGFFGDPMQKIYPTGVGPIKSESGWSEIRGRTFAVPPRSSPSSTRFAKVAMVSYRRADVPRSTMA